MTIDIEEQLIAGMRERADGLTLSLAGALAAGITITGSGTPRPPTTQSAAAPQVRLASAIAATENTSYKVKVTDRSGSGDSQPTITEGAFDPATVTGYLRGWWTGAPDSVYLERLVNGVRYTGSEGSKQWKQERGKFDRLAYSRELAGALGASADPEVLFDALRGSGAKITEAGPGAYQFENTQPYANEYATGTTTVAGKVTVTSDNRIAVITFTSRDEGKFKPGVKDGSAYSDSHSLTVELTGYGTPVKVEKPADTVLVK